MRVLLVEDDASTAKALGLMLKSEGFTVDSTDSGEDGLALATRHGYEVIVLDLMLPDIDGYEVLRKLRSARVETPILILSGLDEPSQKVRGLRTGADDYLTKPFDKAELFARIQAIARRSATSAEEIIQTGRLQVNLLTRFAEMDGKQLPLTTKEYAILELLSLRKGVTLTKEMVLNRLYGGQDEPESKIIDVFVCKLRRKLAIASGGERFIETVWGRGYTLRDPIDKDQGAPSIKSRTPFRTQLASAPASKHSYETGLSPHS